MRCVVLTLLGAAAVALVLAGAVVGFGLYNVSAAVGHLPGVGWILHTTYQNSVELRAPPPSRVPELTEDMAAIGARHFDRACQFCHGTPRLPRSATSISMVPTPPPIEAAAWKWQPAELYWIVRNGVKMSGMPHWPAKGREDEVWLLVAFLQAARQMSAADYAELVRPADDPDPLVSYCAGCHGLDGAGRDNALMPRLDILDESYIAASLLAFRDGMRQSGIMQEAASRLNDAEIAMLARRFGAQEPVTAGLPAPQEELVRQGRDLAFGVLDGRRLPACRACHGPWPAERAHAFPNLEGQHAAYIYRQLQLWKAGDRGGTPRAHIMHLVAEQLDQAQLRALAAYYAAGAPAE